MNLKLSSKERQAQAKRHNRQRFQKVLMIITARAEFASREYDQVKGYIRNLDLKRLYDWAERVTAVAYNTAAEHYAVNQLAALILKAPFDWREFGFELSPRDRAKQKFDDAEERCRKTNKRFDRVVSGRYAPWYSDKLELMRQFVHRVLGESPDLERIFEQCGYGPGANVGVHGNATNIFRKFTAESWSVTPSCIPYARTAVMRNFHLFEALCEERNGLACFDSDVALAKIDGKMRKVPSNSVSFVPKTAKTERSIAVEPLLNSFVQKGIDSEMRRLLLRFGYNLADQEHNSRLAKDGSLDGSLFTLDLSSASDTVSINVVKMLLPGDWYGLLNRTRSPAYLRSGTETRYQKFASMGNGFCFPLETLIFAAAVRACLPKWKGIPYKLPDRRHAVYGDDIIAPTDCYADLVRLLRFCGFTPNEAKSFHEGPFRESCGADWYRGQDVRPVYLDYPLVSTASLMVFHNATLRSEVTSDFFNEVRDYLRGVTPPRERFVRPRSTQKVVITGWWTRHRENPSQVYNLNGAFDVPMDVFLSSGHVRWHRHEQRWSWKEFVYKPISDHGEGRDYERAQYWSFLLGSPGGDVYLRRKTKRLIIVR